MLPEELTTIEEQAILPYSRRALQQPELPFHVPAVVEEPSLEQPPSIGGYWYILMRRRWTVVTAVAVIVTLATIATFKMKPVYQATALLQVDSEIPQVETLNEMYQQVPMDQDFVRTQIEVLQTDNLAWRTIEELRLDEAPSFAPASEKAKDPSDYAHRRKMRLIEEFKKHLSVKLIRGSRVIQVSFESTDPALAAKVANALVDNYLDYNFREKYDATRLASGRLEQQLDELKAKVEKSQQELVEYQREHSIVDVNDKQSVVEQRLAELSTQLTAAQSDRIQKESLYTQVKSDPDKVAALLENDLLQRLGEKYADVKKEYVEALTQYGPAFPKVVRLQKQVDEYQALIDGERHRVADRIGNDYRAALTRESLLGQAVAKQKAELGEFNKLLVQQNILKGEFETNQKLYERLLQHLKDATVSAGLKSSSIHLVDAALVPTEAVQPKKLLNIMLSLFVGLVLGVSLAFTREALDQSIKTPEEVEVLVSMPTLAVIPAKQSLPKSALQLGNGNGNGNGKSNGNGHKPLSSRNGRLELTVLHQPKSVLAESFRSLRTSMLLSMAARPPQVLLVTSAGAGEGKSTISTNLAIALAQQEGDVLIVDCDLRKRALAHTLGLDNRKGLSTVLTGRSTLETSLQRFTSLPRLWALTAGPLPPDPAELLSSSQMDEVLMELRKRFRHIVIDSPPLLMVTDATVLSTMVDGVILVAESGVTPRKSIVRAAKILQRTGAKRLGIALNKVDLRFEGYYGQYYGYYPDGAGKR